MQNSRLTLTAIFGSLLVLFVSAGAFAQSLTPELIVDMKRVSNVVIQPQGDYVAYALRVPRSGDEEPGGGYSELWVAPVDGGEPRQYTRKPMSVYSFDWLPDGSAITFRSRRKDVDPHTQVFAIPLRGGEARQLSHADGSVRGYALSPDGSKLAFTMRDELPEEVSKAHKKGFDQQVEDSFHRITRLYVEDLASGEVTSACEDDLNVWDFSWSPDGSQLLFRGSERPFTDVGYMYTDNYVVPASGGKAELVKDTDGKLGHTEFSPDGRHIAWLGATALNDPSSGSLFVMPADGGEARNLMQDFSGTASSFTWKNANTILLTTIEKTRTYLYEVAVADGNMKKLMGDSGPIFRSVSMSDDGEMLAFAGDAYNHPDELFVCKSNGTGLQQLTHSNPEFENLQFGEQETVSWKGSDDWEIYGVLIKPVGYEEGKSYPLHCQIHGGPESAQLDGWNTYYSSPVQWLAQNGFAVLMPNYRGSTGRGVKYSMGDHNDLMGDEFHDTLAGIDDLAKQGIIDKEKVSIGGGSYGGYTSAWAATKHSERFKAAVVFAGIANQISKAGVTDTPHENALVHWNVWLYDNMDLVWDRSPIKHIRNANTPTLIAHGERDARVPTGQAFELYRGLQHMDVPAELVIYPREPHGLRERSHQLDFCRRMTGWLMEHVKGEVMVEADKYSN